MKVIVAVIKPFKTEEVTEASTRPGSRGSR
jgi:nitrogen regulatory protein PII